MGDGDKGNEVTDNSVNVEQLDGNVTDVSKVPEDNQLAGV